MIFQGENGLYAPATAGCEAGPYTQARGYLGYNEICDRVKKFNFVAGFCLWEHLNNFSLLFLQRNVKEILTIWRLFAFSWRSAY